MKNLISKFLILLHIIKKPQALIELTEYDKMWIKLLKNHYVNDERYHVNASSWIETLKPMFREIYGYEPDEHMSSFRRCISMKLFKLWHKIDPRMHQDNMDFKCDILYGISAKAFHRTISRDYEDPTDRFIAELCGEIQCVRVINDDKTERFNLDISEDV